MKKTYLILFIVISLVGLVSGIYLKFFKTYMNDIRIQVEFDDEESQQRQLNLSENIAFLEELERTFAANSVKRTQTDKLPEVLERLKTINGISIGLIMVSGFVFLGSVQKLYKNRAVSVF